MFQSGSQNRAVMQRKAVERDRFLCWYCKKIVLHGTKWSFVLLMSKSCTTLMLPSSIMYVLEIIMGFEDNASAEEIGKLQINLFLSKFNPSVKNVGRGGFGVLVSSVVFSSNYIGLVTTVGFYFHLCP